LDYQGDLDKDDIVTKKAGSPLKQPEKVKVELPSIKIPIVKRAFEKGLGPKM